MPQVLIPILTFASVTLIGLAILLARQIRDKQQLQQRLSQSMGPPTSGPKQVLESRVQKILHRTGRAVSSNGPSASLRADLAGAGFHGFLAGEVYLGIKSFLFLGGLVVLTFAVLPATSLSITVRILLVLAGAVLLSFVPNVIVGLRRRKRREEVRRGLPEAIDLLEIGVTAGMGMDMAWNSVADEMRRVSPVLADEMTLTNLETHLGTERPTAVQHMADRTDAEELASLSGVLAQSEQFGTSVSDALRSFAGSMREVRMLHAEETAEKMAVKLLIPMILFIFPTILIVTAGPAAIRLVDLLGR